MKISMSSTSGRLAALMAFFGVCALIMYILFSGTGVRRPLVDDGEYTATVVMKDVDNLVKAGQVQIAGVKVGLVRSVRQLPDNGGVEVEFALDDDIAPLHEGAQVRLAERSLVGETYLDLTDGKGDELSAGTELPADAVVPSVQLTDVLASIDKDSRGELRSLVRSLGDSTAGTGDDIDALLSGLGDLGRQGHTALDAIAAQSEDIEELARQTSLLLRALDTGEGQIADLVASANEVTGATAGQREAIEDSLAQAPELLRTTLLASDGLTTLADALGPVARDLREAGPDLTTALEELPATTTDLHGMLAPLSRVFDQAPATLNRVPKLSDDLQAVIPTAQATLADLNPMLSYISPYGPELAAYFANFNAVLNYQDENGAYYLRLTPLFNTHSPQLPVSNNNLLGNYTNAFPAPGTGARPGPFTGRYPRVERLGE
ncbi:MCE family protein [Nocardioides immobilis]|uniref:MCE family protein n=1 Tax=Nocardioides immobilis TaxID=2049295 RepID=A0A417Y741_9ACTN|nr:MlaD family protein [Nocardioides immobilis]RHW28520.1 MCE family protein [Nocardioides immobilis]